jgi:hypothetical protein
MNERAKMKHVLTLLVLLITSQCWAGSAFNVGVVTESGKKRNYIFNGDMSVWQRGTSFSDIQTSYTADRWRCRGKGDIGGSSQVNVSRESFTLGQTDVPNEPSYYMRYNVDVSNTEQVGYVMQPIEGVRTLAGKTATLSFYLRSEVNQTGSIFVQQIFGSGGSPSATVDAYTTSIAFGTSWTKYTVIFTLPSISGKTVGTDGDDRLAVYIRTAENTATYIDLCMIQLEEGSTASAFEMKPYADTLRDCQRYYCNSGGGTYDCIGFASDTNGVGGHWTFPVPMRALPTITITSGHLRNTLTGATVALHSTTPVPYQFATPLGFGVVSSTPGGLTAQTPYDFTFTATAEY